ncbi:UDP-2,3-diacylglucosamine diphosphatase LpxI [Candidatus Pelagibacter sp.]|nr:UDP-2,3-diacylglucosamine diphosphatase LpxI [Candidatus Pelagibacter sp.]
MIGLFLGEKKLPLKILKSIKRKKIKYFIIDLSKNNKFKKDKNSYFINIGKFGKILDLIKSKKCKKVIFAGNIIKPRLSKLKLDIKGIYYIPRIIKASKLGDAAILKELIKILSENKIKVIKLNTFNPELTLKRGCYTKIKPSSSDLITIRKGIQILNKSNSFNHVQALVINNHKIVSFEKRKGTKDMLKSLRKNNLQNKLLLKMPKSKQDLRVDLPTIGLDTLKDCKKANIKGIVVKAGQNIFLDKHDGLKFANKNSIFVIAK